MSDNQKTGTCRHCGQTAIISDDTRKVYEGIEDVDELATLSCQCEDGRDYREAKRQEIVNLQFISFSENGLLAFMRANNLKHIKIADMNGNSAFAMRLEKGGDVKIITSLKKVVY
jgi:hypothetical protein